MTREEAIKILKALSVYECYPKSASEETKEAIDMAIEALKQPPNAMQLLDDGTLKVKVANVLDIKRIMVMDGNIIYDAYYPDRPKGEWLDADGNKVEVDDNGITECSCWCSVCGEWLVASDEYTTKGNYCPNCGADMRCEK